MKLVMEDQKAPERCVRSGQHPHDRGFRNYFGSLEGYRPRVGSDLDQVFGDTADGAVMDYHEDDPSQFHSAPGGAGDGLLS